FPKYVRYVDDARDMAQIIRGEKPSDFSYEHDLNVQTTVLQSAGMSLTD
ncbi:MAG: gfo/Idh/MocA family oxidoreductase, partial [Planctomycetes bacterium]|nr:gfo/Idh/MocA family oxidoreductase [Planctomycetota bacterium]